MLSSTPRVVNVAHIKPTNVELSSTKFSLDQSSGLHSDLEVCIVKFSTVLETLLSGLNVLRQYAAPKINLSASVCVVLSNRFLMS